MYSKMRDKMTKGTDDEKKLLVTGTGRLKAEALCNYFMGYGLVNRVRVYCNSRGRPKGYAMVLFHNCNTVNRVLIDGIRHDIGGRRIYPKRFDNDGKITIHPSSRDVPDVWKIFVGGIAPYISDREIFHYFSQFGHVMRVHTPVEADTDRRKAYCIVTFSNAQPVNFLIKHYNMGHVIKGREVEVRTVFPKYRERVVKNQRKKTLHDEHYGDLWTYANVQRSRMAVRGQDLQFASNFRG